MSGNKSGAPLWQIDAAGVVACLICGVAWYFAGLAPLSEAKANRAALSDELEARQSQHEGVSAKRRMQEERLAKIVQEIGRASITLQNADQINAQLKSITELAAECKLRLDEIRPGTPAGFPHYTAVPIRVAGQGSYRSVVRFLHAVQTRYQDVGITGFDLRGEPEAIDKASTFSVQLLWYAAPAAAKGK